MATSTAILHKEEDMCVAKCPEVETVGQSKTIEKALANLKEATELWKNSRSREKPDLSRGKDRLRCSYTPRAENRDHKMDSGTSKAEQRRFYETVRINAVKS